MTEQDGGVGSGHRVPGGGSGLVSGPTGLSFKLLLNLHIPVHCSGASAGMPAYVRDDCVNGGVTEKALQRMDRNERNMGATFRSF